MRWRLKILGCLRSNRSLTSITRSKNNLSLRNKLSIEVDRWKGKGAKYPHAIQFFNPNNKYPNLNPSTYWSQNKGSNSHKMCRYNPKKKNKTSEGKTFKVKYPLKKISWISLLISAEGCLIVFKLIN